MSGLEKRPRRGDRPRKNDDFLAWKTAGSFYERIFDFSLFGALSNFQQNKTVFQKNMNGQDIWLKSVFVGVILSIVWYVWPKSSKIDKKEEI